VSSQLHAAVALTPGKNLLSSIGPQSCLGHGNEEKNCASSRNDTPIVQPVVHHFCD